MLRVQRWHYALQCRWLRRNPGRAMAETGIGARSGGSDFSQRIVAMPSVSIDIVNIPELMGMSKRVANHNATVGRGTLDIDVRAASSASTSASRNRPGEGHALSSAISTQIAHGSDRMEPFAAFLCSGEMASRTRLHRLPTRSTPATGPSGSTSSSPRREFVSESMDGRLFAAIVRLALPRGLEPLFSP
jgi:hypothetical protein